MTYKLYYGTTPTEHESVTLAEMSEDDARGMFAWFKQGGVPITTVAETWSAKTYGDGKAHYYSLALVKVDAVGKESGFLFWQNPDWVGPVAPPVIQTVYRVYFEKFADGYAKVQVFAQGTPAQVALSAKTFYDTLYTSREITEADTELTLKTGFSWPQKGTGLYEVVSDYDRISYWDETDPKVPSIIEGWDRKWNAASPEGPDPFTTPPNTVPPAVVTPPPKEEPPVLPPIGGGGIISAAQAIAAALDKALSNFTGRVTASDYPGGPIAQAAADEMAAAFAASFAPIADDLAKWMEQQIQEQLKGLGAGVAAVTTAINPVNWLNDWWNSVRQTFATMLVGGVIIIIVALSVYYFWRRTNPDSQMQDMLRMQMMASLQQQVYGPIKTIQSPEMQQAVLKGAVML